MTAEPSTVEEPPPDRPGLRAEHLHPGSPRHGRRRDDRGVRRRDPGPGRLGADRNLRGHAAGRSDVEPPAGNPPLGQIKLMPIDYEQIEKDAKSLKTRFNEIYQ